MLLAFLGTLLMGLGVGLMAWAGADNYIRWMNRWEADFRDKLRRLRIRTPRLRVYLNFWVGFVTALFLTVWIFFGWLILGLSISLLLLGLPWYIVKRMAEKRKLMIEDQLADAMVQLSSAVKAGLSLPQALDILAAQTPKPICQEFQQMVGEYQLGKPLEKCLSETKERLRSENFALFTAAMEASRESGGRLNETVERIAISVRELQRLERKVQSETAQARASAFYMALFPLLILALYFFFLDRENTVRLFQEVLGQIMLSVSLILNITAYLWARKILNPDI